MEYDEEDISAAEIEGRKYRITVPLAGIDDGVFKSFPSRVPLGGDAYIARLNKRESTRLTNAHYPDSSSFYQSINHRLEILNVSAYEVYEAWNLLEAQFGLVLRRPLSVKGAVLDRQVDGIWRRGGHLNVPESSDWFDDFPVDRLETLRSLREGMGGFNGEPVARAADLYSQSIKALSRNERDNAFILSAVALETLLGFNLNTEISYRIALRATALEGGSSKTVFFRTRKLYSVRSSVVHSGKHASFTDVTHMQQALMRLIPSMSALSKDFGGYERAIDHLDELAWNRNRVPSSVISGGGWWSYVPLAQCFDRNYNGFDDPNRSSRVWLFDY